MNTAEIIGMWILLVAQNIENLIYECPLATWILSGLTRCR